MNLTAARFSSICFASAAIWRSCGPALRIVEYLDGFGEEPGYLDFAAFGPISAAVVAESAAQEDLVRRARWGAKDRLDGNAPRMQDAAAVLTGFRSDQIVFQPSTGQGITQAIYGLAGGVLLSAAEYPSLPIAVARASEALQVVTPIPFEADKSTFGRSAMLDQRNGRAQGRNPSLAGLGVGKAVDGSHELRPVQIEGVLQQLSFIAGERAT